MQPPHYDREQLDVQYRVRNAVPDFQSYLDRWTDDSFAACHTLSGERDIQYGPSADETLDVFVPAGTVEHAPVQILIHGGYWRALSKDDFTFLAAAIVPAGVVAVVVNYALCPDVTMSVLVDQCRRAMIWTSRNIGRFGGDPNRLHLTGHSAGAAETDAFRWQTAAYAASMRSQGANCVAMEIPGHHHYSMMGVLCDGCSAAQGMDRQVAGLNTARIISFLLSPIPPIKIPGGLQCLVRAWWR